MGWWQVLPATLILWGISGETKEERMERLSVYCAEYGYHYSLRGVSSNLVLSSEL